MTTRRTFIQSLAALPPALAFSPGWAAGPDPARQALVIGNGDYRAAPLVNPANDARAVDGLLQQAGFTVTSRIDSRRTDMLTAIEDFGRRVRHADTQLAVFYYAGHGAQLDWRNYLLPVDVHAETPAQIRQQCVDLGFLLDRISAVQGRTFVIILDACRNDPFGGGYRVEQKGLSQFDAPAGCLLAYSTAPGKVASDGEGNNSLYTENLIRELSVRSVRVEDALKRVRLHVRLASGGEQTPWETTSLESDVYLFADGARKLSDADIEKAFEQELEEWKRIKDSDRLDDWIGYLHRHPNGRFAEIAQVRLGRLLPKLRRSPPPVATTAAAAAPAAIDIRPGGAVPAFLQKQENPYSAGLYPLDRHYTVGDEATFRESDLLTNQEVRVYTHRVTRVVPEQDRVEINDGKVILDMMGNSLKNGPITFDVPLQLSPAELQVGKKWTAAFKRTADGQTSTAFYDLHIAAREKVGVPAGEFDAFRIEGVGWNQTFGSRLQVTLWLLPGLGFPVKREWITRNRRGDYRNTERHELVSLRQQHVALR
jgi:hypothetical protein